MKFELEITEEGMEYIKNNKSLKYQFEDSGLDITSMSNEAILEELFSYIPIQNDDINLYGHLVIRFKE